VCQGIGVLLKGMHAPRQKPGGGGVGDRLPKVTKKAGHGNLGGETGLDMGRGGKDRGEVTQTGSQEGWRQRRGFFGGKKLVGEVDNKKVKGLRVPRKKEDKIKKKGKVKPAVEARIPHRGGILEVKEVLHD